MERSQSCSSFDIANNNKNINYNNSNNTNNNNNNVNITKSYHKLRGCTTTTHQIHHQQQQQQQHLKQSGSSESLNIMTTTTTTTTTITSNVNSGSTTLPRYTARRRNKLERQISTSITDIDDDEYQEDSAYHGDLEEEEEEDDDQTPDDRSEDRTVSRQLYQKHLQFAQNKTQSESMITIPTAPSERRLKHGDSFDSSVTKANQSSPASQRRQRFAFLPRDNSVNSDSSRYSSVDSLLEARKPDPEAILINLGFGPVGSEDILSRIPKRFLKPSQVRGIDTDAFVKRLQLASNLADHSVLGYRGLTGNPDVPPSSIVAKIMQRFEVNQRKKSMGGIE